MSVVERVAYWDVGWVVLSADMMADAEVGQKEYELVLEKGSLMVSLSVGLLG